MLRALSFCVLLVVQARAFSPAPVQLRAPHLKAMGVGFHVQGRSMQPIAREPRPLRLAARRPMAAGMHMSEKKPDVFHDATVMSNTEACEGMRKLIIKVDPNIATSYK